MGKLSWYQSLVKLSTVCRIKWGQYITESMPGAAIWSPSSPCAMNRQPLGGGVEVEVEVEVGRPGNPPAPADHYQCLVAREDTQDTLVPRPAQPYNFCPLRESNSVPPGPVLSPHVSAHVL